MSLHDSCILVALRVTLPPQTRTSKHASAEVEYKYRTAKKQGRVTKRLFSDTDIKPLSKAMTEARTTFNEISLPYDASYRLIPSSTYFEFTQTMTELSQKFDTKKMEFLRNYPDILHRAEAALGDLFDHDNYPSTTRLDNIVNFSIESSVVPPVNAFDDLAGITAAEIEVLKEQALAGQNEKVEQALGDLFQRLFDALSKAKTKLAVEDSVFRDTLLSNIHDSLRAVDTLNFAKNQDLIDLANEVRTLVDGISPQALRDDKELRKQTAEETQEVLKKMQEFF